MENTELEIKVLKAYWHTDIIKGEYTDGRETWTDEVIKKSRLGGNIARGVISSLVQKGLVAVGESGSDSTFALTKAGVELSRKLGFIKE